MDTQYDLTVIIPTYREGENIADMIHTVEGVLANSGINGEILVVDDSSPDGTISAVRALEATLPNLRLVVRTTDPGLSQSVVDGFGLARSPVFMVIDADFSHPVELIPRFLGEIRRGADVVVGSRYMKGGGIEDWPLSRRVISSGATLLGRVLFPEITDPVSGFFAVKKEVVAGAPLHPRGYKILMEVLGKGRWTRAVEIPFVFRNRKSGSSKLSGSTILDYVRQVSDISIYALTERRGAAWEEWRRILRFGIVGLSGIVVNIGLLWVLTAFAGIPDLVSLAIAIELSIVNNFLWNEHWTFGGGEGHRLGDVRTRFVSFQAVSIGGALINWVLYFLLTRWAGVFWLLANLVAILVAFAWNYLVNRNLTWR
ncbi:MAG TPA: glycosyltransferase family 2 protein, partial [Methanomicrobiales archaeon]|nr:glycosyltransferase family 2 protein [Methanomicrobiales archaeon]